MKLSLKELEEQIKRAKTNAEIKSLKDKLTRAKELSRDAKDSFAKILRPVVPKAQEKINDFIDRANRIKKLEQEIKGSP